MKHTSIVECTLSYHYNLLFIFLFYEFNLINEKKNCQISTFQVFFLLIISSIWLLNPKKYYKIYSISLIETSHYYLHCLRDFGRKTVVNRIFSFILNSNGLPNSNCVQNTQFLCNSWKLFETRVVQNKQINLQPVNSMETVQNNTRSKIV